MKNCSKMKSANNEKMVIFKYSPGIQSLVNCQVIRLKSFVYASCTNFKFEKVLLPFAPLRSKVLEAMLVAFVSGILWRRALVTVF